MATVRSLTWNDQVNVEKVPTQLPLAHSQACNVSRARTEGGSNSPSRKASRAHLHGMPMSFNISPARSDSCSHVARAQKNSTQVLTSATMSLFFSAAPLSDSNFRRTITGVSTHRVRIACFTRTRWRIYGTHELVRRAASVPQSFNAQVAFSCITAPPPLRHIHNMCTPIVNTSGGLSWPRSDQLVLTN